MKTLKEVKVGENAVVKRLHGEGATKRRIMGLTVRLSWLLTGAAAVGLAWLLTALL